tara:strand:+ start:853 stop:1287 length:435 start_codon:yes stop_codon:yes gene_type:complete
MQIILLESLTKLGKAGDIVTVKDGYANNYLIPEKKAIVANKANKTDLKNRMSEINSNNQKKIEEAKITKSKIDNTEIALNIEANEEGKLYGAITQKQISEALLLKDIEISPDMVILTPIKTVGNFEIKIRIYEDIGSSVKLVIS